MQGEHSRSAVDVGATVSKATPAAQLEEKAWHTRSADRVGADVSNSASASQSVTLVHTRSDEAVGTDDS